jgi:hypothetical protein
LVAEDGALAVCLKLVDNSALSLKGSGDVLRANIAASANLLAGIVIVASTLAGVKCDICGRI